MPQTQDQIEKTIASILIENIEKDDSKYIEINLDASFSSFGLDSLKMVELISKIEDTLNCDLEPDLAFNYPTIRSLAEYIESKRNGK